jgi:hypothetical protein
MVAATVANASGRYQRKLKPADFSPPKAKKLKLSKQQEKRLKELRNEPQKSVSRAARR